MKKLLALLLALCMVIAMTACSGNQTESQSGGSSAETPASTSAEEPTSAEPTGDQGSGETYTAGMVILGLGSEFFQSMADTFVSVFESNGWEASYVNGEFDPATQIQAIENYTAAQVDLLVVFPSDGESVDDALARAREAGVKVIEMVNCGENWDVQMISDDAMMAELLCLQTAAWVNEHFADAEDGSVDVVVMSYYANDTNRAQSEGALRIAEYSPKINLLAEYELNAESTEAGVTAAENVLTSYPDVDVIISPQGTVMVGVNNYLTSMNSPVTDYTDMGLFAVNASSQEAFDAIAASANDESPFRGTVITSGVDRTISDIYDFAVGLMDGTYENYTSYASTELITADTVAEYLENGTITSYTEDDLLEEVGVYFYH